MFDHPDYHIGIVVHDCAEAVAHYSNVLNITTVRLNERVNR